MPQRRATDPVDESTWQGRLRRARLNSGLSTETLAEAVGVASKQSIYDWEKARSGKTPNPDRLIALIKALGASADEIFFGTPGTTPEPNAVHQLTAVAELLDPAAQRALLALAEHYLAESRRTTPRPTPAPLRAVAGGNAADELEDVPVEDRGAAREFLQEARERAARSEGDSARSGKPGRQGRA